MIPAHIEHVFKALDRIERRELQQPMPGSPALVEGSSPTAGIGTADAGTSPIVRYWTVKFERGGRTHFTAVEACDVLKATLVVFKRHEGANGVQVVREIQRDEFEHLTRSSP